MSVLLRRAWWLFCQRSNWLVIVLGLEAVIGAAAIAAGGQMQVASAIAICPLLACARSNVRVTTLVTFVGLALCVLVVRITHPVNAEARHDPFLRVLVIGLLAILVAVVRGRRETRLVRIAENVQHAILRPLPADLGGIGFASHYQSATPGTLVGGDLYDLTMTQFGPRIIVGDVKGKGLDAVGLCAAVIGTFREFAFAEPDLVELARSMDNRLSAELGIEDFVTVVLAEFGDGEVRLVNCGHQPPVKVGADSAGQGARPAAGPSLEIIAAVPPVPPLGLQPRPSRQAVALKPGERLLFYTDGLVEARNPSGRFLALDDRVAEALAAPTLDACIRAVRHLLLQHVGYSLDDDVLLVVCEPLTPN